MQCKICGFVIDEVFDIAKVLEKYDVSYYRCGACGFVQTEEPYWLEEAYSEAIGDYDLGLVSRNLIAVTLAKTVIGFFFNRHEKFLDYGGGYGLFVRMMRDKGFDFYLYDPNCENLFSKNFQVDLSSNRKFHMLTAFEVFEHFVDPLSDIERLLEISPNVFFSTSLLPVSCPPKPSQWWYYGLKGGQHIALYTVDALRHIAKKLNVNMYSDGVSYHLLTKKRISSVVYNLVVQHRFSRIASMFIRQPSLLPKDYLDAVNREESD